MEDGVLLTRSTNKDHNRSSHSDIKMLQRQAPSSSYNTNNCIIPTNKHSRLITKHPHKIRIIHIIPPEIIRIDKTKFKELVQSLTGRSSSATKTGIKKHQMPQVMSADDLKMSYLLGFNDSNINSNDTKLSSSKKLLDYDPCKNHEQLKFDDVASDDHEILIGGVQEENDDVIWNYDQVRNIAKVENEEIMVVQGDQDDTDQWGMLIKQEQLENEFCIDGFLELDEWLSQDNMKLPNLLPNASSNLGIDRYLLG